MPGISAQARAVFFDAVGTVLFPEPSAPRVYAQLAQDHGLAISEAEVRYRFLKAYQRQEIADASMGWATSEGRERDRWRQIVAETLHGVDDTEACYRHLFDHFAQPSAWRVAPDASSILATLHRRNLRLGLGSNFDARLLGVCAGFPELCALNEMIVISSVVGVRKPGTAFFHALADRARCAISEIVFVGDDVENDSRGAASAGMTAILLDPQDQHPTVPSRIKSLAQLIE